MTVIRNNNGAVLGKLTMRSLKSGKMRNILIIITVALSAALISGLAGFSTGLQTEEERQLATMQHVIYMNVAPEQLTLLKEDGHTEDMLTYKQGQSYEVDNYLLSPQYFAQDSKIIAAPTITKGRMPEKMNEVVVNKGYMERIGMEAETGAEISVTWLDGSTEFYTVSGYTDNHFSGNLFQIIFSEEYAENGSQLKDVPYHAAIRIFGAEKMNQAEFLEEIRNIGEKYGIARPDINENNFFVLSLSRDLTETLVIVCISAAVLLASVLVIYSIFYISVTGRIRQFGQLRTLGMTTKQLKKTVRLEGIFLSAAGIPIGLIIGTVFAFLVKPMGFSLKNTLIIWLLTAAAVIITVLFSIKKPAKTAAGAPPIEAVRLSGYTYSGKNTKNRKLTPFGLAKISADRNRKKTTMTALSLGISGILFLAGTTLLTSFNREEYSRQGAFRFGEYILRTSNNAVQAAEHGLSDIQADNPLTDGLEKEIMALDGVLKVTPVKLFSVNFEYHDYRSDDSLSPVSKTDMDILNKYREGGEPFDYDELVKDKKIIIHNNFVAKEIYGWKFQTGDTVSLRYFDGTDYREDSFTIAGSAEKIDLDGTERAYQLSAFADGFFYIPEELLENMLPKDFNITNEFIISVEDYKTDTSVKEFLENCTDNNPVLRFGTLSEELQNNESTFLFLHYMVLGISAFITSFAMINLINTLVSNAMARKQEFATLGSIGMSSLQLKQMIIGEGLILAAQNIILTIIFGTAAGYLLVIGMSKTGASYMHWHFPILYLLCYAVFIILVPVVISAIIIKILDKKSLVDRLREI